MKKPFVFAVSLILAASAAAQDAPKVKYSGSGVNRRVVDMSDMLGEVPYMECTRVSSPVIGKIVKRDFDEDEVTVASIVLADARDKRHSININDSKVGLLGHSLNEIVPTFLSKGRRVQVWTYKCTGGGSGIFIYADRIKAL